MSELCDRQAVELRSLIAGKDITPLELLESCIARIEAVNPRLNAIVASDFERARDAAREAEAAVMRGDDLGPLHGLPIGIKDLNETAGLRTTYGSELFADFVPSEDDWVTASLRAAGGIITAKTNTPEFGAGANTVNRVYGFTGNPFDADRICGGSSGGSAVALATSMLPLASGSDMGGSLRTPAAYCGIIGFRGSPGLVPSPGRMFPWSPLSQSGPMARNMADLRLMHSALRGFDPRDPSGSPLHDPALATAGPCDLGGLRVAFSEDLGFAPIDNGIRATFRARCDEMRGLFASCEAVEPGLSEAEFVFEVLRAVEFLASHKELIESHPDKVGPNVTANVELGLTYTVMDVARAHRSHGELYRSFVEFMRGYDVMICPTASVPPFGKDKLYMDRINGEEMATYIGWMGITYGLTLTGHPIVVLPCGLDETGAPFGVQVVGHMKRDAELLDIATALEAALAGLPGCARPLPDLAALSA